MKPQKSTSPGPLRRLVQRLSGRSSGPDDLPLWQLWVGDELLGDLVYVSHDTPWLTCEFRPTERFEFYRPYFDWAQALADASERSPGPDDSPSGGPASAAAAADPITLTLPAPSEPLEQTQAVKRRGGVRILSAQSGEVWRPSIRFYDEYRLALFAVPGMQGTMP
ncbi:hypothetical protein [Amphibiibacter pelophylacis]|uniref:Uncharacterized protein n=1 Tax=Amphibiibacter pelophylacis TaxID=1799477 RepID=A0ACC6P376_9BURK